MLRVPSFGCPILRKLSASGGLAPLIPGPGALPLDFTGGSTLDPRYRLALCAPMVRAPPLFCRSLRLFRLVAYCSVCRQHLHVVRMRITVAQQMTGVVVFCRSPAGANKTRCRSMQRATSSKLQCNRPTSTIQWLLIKSTNRLIDVVIDQATFLWWLTNKHTRPANFSSTAARLGLQSVTKRSGVFTIGPRPPAPFELQKNSHRPMAKMQPQRSFPNSLKYYMLMCRKITKIVAARCQILRLKCTKFDFGWAPPQTPLGELTTLPKPLAGFKGAYF